MNVNAILNYEKNPAEDFYTILGCDPESSSEQILTEFKVRAKEFHPDRCGDNQPLENQAKFQQLLEAKNILIDPEQRKRYDAWRNSGIAMSYKQWIGLKDSVQASMHWVTPKTAGRMLQTDNLLVEKEDELVSLKTSPVTDRDVSKEYPEANTAAADDDDSDDVHYEPVPYDQLGYRVETPPPELEMEASRVTKKPEDDNKPDESSKKAPMIKTRSVSKDGSSEDPKTAMRRKLFAIRRESTIGTMVMAERLDDNEIRRKFRNYEI